MASEAAGKEAVAVMTQLNKKAREILDKFTIHACTDVTGFGLLGHCGEMASASRAKIELWPKDIAYIEGAKEYAQMGLIPGGAYRNRNHVAQLLEAGNTDEMYVDLLSDPQTSAVCWRQFRKKKKMRFWKNLIKHRWKQKCRLSESNRLRM